MMILSRRLVFLTFSKKFHRRARENRNIFQAAKSYKNAELMKSRIIKENRNKSGIFRWVNNTNNNSYVGSGINLAKRIGDYYKKSELMRNPRPINFALLKYKHNNFTLEIIEYCSKEKLFEREQYYIDLFKPKYNIFKFAYSLLGFKHSVENIAKFKLKKISQEHKDILYLTHSGKIVSQYTRDKLSLATKNYRKHNPLTPEALANLKAKSIERKGVEITVLNIKTNEV